MSPYDVPAGAVLLAFSLAVFAWGALACLVALWLAAVARIRNAQKPRDLLTHPRMTWAPERDEEATR